MKPLLWKIPLAVLLGILAIRLIIAPYDIYQNQQATITKLQDAQAQKDSTKQEIRSFLKTVNPEILQRIDLGEEEIRVDISQPKQMKLVALSTLSNFYNYLSFQHPDYVAVPMPPRERPPVFIMELGCDINNSSSFHTWYLYPKDALREK
jgi:hypothetical protein